MKLPLDEDYFILSDNFSFKLYKYERLKDGIGQRVQSYHTTFNSCLGSYIQERLKNSKVKKNSELLQELADIKNHISNLYKFIEDNSYNNVYASTLYELLQGKNMEK